jgi:DNA-directed DNA polymerase III PolC
MFVHLTTHSSYSLQESTLTPAQLAHLARKNNMPALGMTDHWLLTGAVEFVQACLKEEIQPVLGLEIDLKQGKVALFAQNLSGWSTLCRLSSTLALRENPTDSCSPEYLEQFAEGLLALALPETIQSNQTLTDIFKGNLYLSLQNRSQAISTANLARQINLPVVVSQPIYCERPEEIGLLNTLRAIRENQPIHMVRSQGGHSSQPVHFSGMGEILVQFSGMKSAIKNTLEIAERCQFDFPLNTSHMPVVSLPEGIDQTQFLRQKAENGIRRIYGEITPEIQTRLDHELEIISKMGYEPIFLIVEDILNYARQENIPYSSRGSAASSLVAHSLGITSPDPLRLNLYFERFLNPARITPPDIDTDLCSRGRDNVIDHVFQKYGSDRVAMVATINRYRPRSALNDVAKAHNLSPASIKALTRKLPHSFWARRSGSEPDTTFAELQKNYTAENYQKIFEQAEAILGLPRHLSVHPGGLVIAPGSLTDLVPVMRSGSKGTTITQMDLEAVESLGLVKIDLLGIRGLTVLGDVADFIQAESPESFPSSLSVLDSVPQEDTPTADTVEHGYTIGCFQIESPGMRATLREIHARSEEDIMAALALYRPGPLTGGLKDAFVRRFKGEEKISHIHPALAPLLEETYGVILYQEQVLRIANSLAGFSLAEGDLLRRAMSHFDPGDKMKDLKEKFMREAQARSGIPTDTGQRIWEMMAAFAGYGFPKAHAASYAQIGWRSAWCKTHFPAHFMAAVLAGWGGYYSQRVYVSEARRLGLNVRPPHINFSDKQFTVGNRTDRLAAGPETLYMGLEQVKHLSRRTIQNIIHSRPFYSLEDFLTRAAPKPVEAENLARIGALEGMGKIPAILESLKQGWRAGQMSLFSSNPFDGQDWGLEQKMEAQIQLLGISLDAHPLELLTEQLAEHGVISTSEAAAKPGQHVRVAGVRQVSRRSQTERGERMLFLTIEDMSGVIDIIVQPKLYRWKKQLLTSRSPLLFAGIVEINEMMEPYIIAEEIMSLEN